MNPSEIDVKAQHLHAFLQGLPTFPDVSEVFEPYGHMGATLTDAVLQPGLNYERAVKPRVAQVLALYPEARTTSAFKAVLDVEGAAHVLNVANARKQQSLRDLVALLMEQDLQTEGALRAWLTDPEHRARLQEIKGVKTKTCHYLQILCGDRDAVAVDVNLRTVFTCAGIEVNDDEELAAVVKRTAERMQVTPAGLDGALWSWVASGPRTATVD
ncbi:HhH-GDP family DNA glycosylase [Deinococcus ficus]|uniref:hypothetical protein n=1 Tax=Deinococcus ficus TaxID=317577 RepID=UPI0003B77C20|nr:hypothetical protein [Deinococcus ficus]